MWQVACIISLALLGWLVIIEGVIAYGATRRSHGMRWCGDTLSDTNPGAVLHARRQAASYLLTRTWMISKRGCRAACLRPNDRARG